MQRFDVGSKGAVLHGGLLTFAWLTQGLLLSLKDWLALRGTLGK